MPKWSKEKHELEKERVRSVLVRKPNASKYELARILSIDHKTALRLKNQVIRENTRRVSDQKINKEIGKLEAEYEQLALECWQIITQDVRKVKVTKKIGEGKKEKDVEVETEIIITAKEKMNAVRTLIDAKKTLFNIKFDAGIFSRKLGELELKDKLSDKERALLKKAIQLDYGNTTEPKQEKESESETTATEGETEQRPNTAGEGD